MQGQDLCPVSISVPQVLVVVRVAASLAKNEVWGSGDSLSTQSIAFVAEFEPKLEEG